MKPSAYEIGTKYARNGQYDMAIDFLLPAFLCEGSFAAANDLGVIFERKGNYDKAMKYYNVMETGCATKVVCDRILAFYQKTFGGL